MIVVVPPRRVARLDRSQREHTARGRCIGEKDRRRGTLYELGLERSAVQGARNALGAAWLVNAFGIDYFGNVTAVNFWGYPPHPSPSVGPPAQSLGAAPARAPHPETTEKVRSAN